MKPTYFPRILRLLAPFSTTPLFKPQIRFLRVPPFSQISLLLEVEQSLRRDGRGFGSREVLREQPPAPSLLRPRRWKSRPPGARLGSPPRVGRRGPLVHGRLQLPSPSPPGTHREEIQKRRTTSPPSHLTSESPSQNGGAEVANREEEEELWRGIKSRNHCMLFHLAMDLLREK